ncbi:MAG: hypothetical protein ONB23_00255 [candidate division KSB1 bacterium]|nr:hypothetical protein [candidate division KSB1 bacterium]
MRGKSSALWAGAVIITLASAVWQRTTGPTYPHNARVTLAGGELQIPLPRTHAGPGDEKIQLEVPDTSVSGTLIWRRYPTAEPWRRQALERQGSTLIGHLPHQPPAGKLEYWIELRQGEKTIPLTKKPLVIRFRGEVPGAVLAGHILAMFLFMLFSNRAGLEALSGGPRAKAYGRTGFALLIVGGFVLGPIVQHYAFGQWWTGFPFGYDLTDNKTLIAAVVWLWALVRSYRKGSSRGALLFAAAVTLVVFLIPHSMWGSELKWEEVSSGPHTP